MRQQYEDAEWLLQSKVPELEQPDFPELLSYAWNWFWELRNTVASGMNGHEPIGYEQIRAWNDLLQIDIAPWEVKLIRELDKVFLTVCQKPTAE